MKPEGEHRVLLSMTGFGEASAPWDQGTVSVEIRTVNNRYLKVSVRGSEPYPMLEPELEKIVRKYVRRGTVTIHVRTERQYRAEDVTINVVALRSYLEQVKGVCESIGWSAASQAVLANVLTLPGIAPEPGGPSGRPPEEEHAAVEKALEEALKKLHQMRQTEGRAMGEELLGLRREICNRVDQVKQSMPVVVANYRNRLRERVLAAIAEHDVRLRPEDLIREVAIFAERTDVAEEVTRLGSHLDQFESIVRTEVDSPGRKLEFLVQEMGREANTIGSKAGDVSIARHVVDIKAALEKVRELVQNVE